MTSFIIDTILFYNIETGVHAMPVKWLIKKGVDLSTVPKFSFGNQRDDRILINKITTHQLTPLQVYLSR